MENVFHSPQEEAPQERTFPLFTTSLNAGFLLSIKPDKETGNAELHPVRENEKK